MTTQTDLDNQAIQKLKDKLNKSEEKYKNLITMTNTGYLIMDTKLNVIEVNENFMKMMNSPQNDLIGKHLRSWVCSKFINIYDAAFKCLLSGDKIINNLELPLQNTLGEKIHVSINANLTINGETKVLCLISNISDRKMMQQAKYIKEEQKKDRIKKGILDLQKHIKTFKS